VRPINEADDGIGCLARSQSNGDSLRPARCAHDGVSWRADGKPLLFDHHGNPKPAFAAVIRVAAGGG